MKSEQLFEIDRQINQIKRSIEQRQERVTEWEVPVRQILKEKKNKQYYLSKKYAYCHHKQFNDSQPACQQSSSKLKDHVEMSRTRIKFFKNDLKQLQELIKKRSIIRLIKMNQKGHNHLKKIVSNELNQSKGSLTKKEFSKTNYQPNSTKDSAKRNDKEHSVFDGIKGQKILELYQENKAKIANNDQVISSVKKQLGIGLQNTPFYSWLEVKSTNQKLITKNKSNYTNSFSKQSIQYNLYDSLKKQVEQKKKIYLLSKNEDGQKFEQRLKNIIRFHQNNLDSLTP